MLRKLTFGLVLGASCLTCFAANQKVIDILAATDQYFLKNKDVNYQKTKKAAMKIIQDDINNGLISSENSQAYAQQIASQYAHALLFANCLRSNVINVKPPKWIADFLGGKYPNSSNKLKDMSVGILHFYKVQFDENSAKILSTKECNRLVEFADFYVQAHAPS